MKQITIFIDESGTLPDLNDQVIIVAAVASLSPTTFTKLFSPKIKKEALRTKSTEIKYYTAGDRTKQKFFEELVKIDLDIYLLIVDKLGRKIADTPINFSVLNSVLLREVLSFYEDGVELIFDKHFQKPKDIQAFDKQLRELLDGQGIKISHVDSQENKLVNVADMVAGATLAHLTSKNSHFYEMFQSRVIVEIRIKWPEVKDRLFEKKKLA